MSFFAENRVGELISRIKNDLAAIQETLTFTMLEMLRQTIFLFGGIIFIMTQSLPLTIPILIAMPVLIAIAVLFGRKIRIYSRRTQDALAASATITEEALQAIVSVKSYSNETYETTRYLGALNVTVELAVATAKLRSAFVSFVIFAFFGGIAGVVWYGVSLVRAGDITLGDFATFLIYAMFVGGAMGSFAELFGQVQKALGATGRVQEILDMKTEPTKESDASITLRSVRFERVSFVYSTRRDAPALRDVSFELRAGERIAFVGESGAGKTTTAALIQRLYEPSAGRIFYDETSSAELSLADTRRNIGAVPQDIVLFGGTIAENIRYGNLDAGDEEVWRAAELANAAEFIERLPDGLQTIVGERGVQLSGGQRQRIAIARAILKNPPILILDEATSSLDSQSEYLIQEAIERLAVNRATVIIAHRLSTVRRCDRIYVFSGGRIVEHGTHDELSANPDSIYANLSRLQFS
jgi:ABC-type multidrug transport system fused ATPase/permease subunit